MKYLNPDIEALVQYASAGKEGKYNETLERLKKEQPNAYRSLKRAVQVHHPHLDRLWILFNIYPGGTPTEVEAMEKRLAKIKLAQG